MKETLSKGLRGRGTIAVAVLFFSAALVGLLVTTGPASAIFPAAFSLSAGRQPAQADQGATSRIDASTADDRFGVILLDNTYHQQTLQLLGLRWYFEYSFDGPEVPPGITKVLKVRSNELADIEDLRATARSRPGSYWLIGNEPNTPAQDDLDPQAYALAFRYYVSALKGADPRAKIVAPEILNFDSTCLGCSGYTPGREWLEQFRATYRSLYSEEPPVDIWSIHTYDLNWLQLPQGDYLEQVKELRAFRDYLDAIPEQRGKPIWLTEFSVVWAYDGIRWETSSSEPLAHPVGELRRDRLVAYLNAMVGWLRANAEALNLQRWFLFSSHAYQEPWASAPGGIALVEGTGPSARLTELGQLYRSLAYSKSKSP